jgi:hypothetical protein
LCLQPNKMCPFSHDLWCVVASLCAYPWVLLRVNRASRHAYLCVVTQHTSALYQLASRLESGCSFPMSADWVVPLIPRLLTALTPKPAVVRAAVRRLVEDTSSPDILGALPRDKVPSDWPSLLSANSCSWSGPEGVYALRRVRPRTSCRMLIVGLADAIARGAAVQDALFDVMPARGRQLVPFARQYAEGSGIPRTVRRSAAFMGSPLAYLGARLDEVNVLRFLMATCDRQLERMCMVQLMLRFVIRFRAKACCHFMLVAGLVGQLEQSSLPDLFAWCSPETFEFLIATSPVPHVFILAHAVCNPVDELFRTAVRTFGATETQVVHALMIAIHRMEIPTELLATHLCAGVVGADTRTCLAAHATHVGGLATLTRLCALVEPGSRGLLGDFNRVLERGWPPVAQWLDRDDVAQWLAGCDALSPLAKQKLARGQNISSQTVALLLTHRL